MKKYTNTNTNFFQIALRASAMLRLILSPLTCVGEIKSGRRPRSAIPAMLIAMLIVLVPIAEAQAMQGPEDTTPPEITEVLLTHGPTTLATWTTSEPANSKINFGSTTEMLQNITKADYETAHSLILNTTPATTYYYTITSCDAEDNCKSTNIQTFTAGPFYVKAEIPRYSRSTTIEIPGTTRPGAEVTVLVNNNEVRRAVIDDGTFLFKNIEIRQTNNITLKATKGTESAQASYETEVDNKPPLINVTLPPVTTTQTITAAIKTSEPVNLTISYANKTINTSVTATADIKIDLQEGENIITFTAQDKAGFKSTAEERTLYDKGPPEFIQTNLAQLSPSYRQEIHAKGKLSEQGSITAFVNGKPQKTEPTNPDGTFSVPIKLERKINYTADKTRSTLDTGIYWANMVRLEAVDAAGLKKTTEEVEVRYTLCGEGTWIDVEFTDPMPTMLNPRLMIEGIQQIGIAFNYTYRGGYKAVIEPRNVRVKTVALAPEFQDEYDNGIVTVSSPPVRAQRGTKPSGAGYIQVNFQPIDPWAMEGETAPENSTMYEKEEKLSKHRMEHCLVPRLGCIKLFLELDIPFQEDIPEAGYLPETTTPSGKKLESRTQKTCINVEIAIDQRIPPKYIPSSFLKKTATGLTKLINNIDYILKPVETVGQYLLYTCLATTLLSYVPIFLEKYNCQYSNIASAASGKGAFDEKVAAIGVCEEEYGTESKSASNCKACQTWKKNRQWYERTYRQICDRIACPAAPSLQYYLRTRGMQGTVQVKADNAQKKLTQYSEGLFSGSDCAAWIDKYREELKKETGGKLPPKLTFTSQQVQDIYLKWREHLSDSAGEKKTGKINCAGLHPAHADCCGYEYMQEWSSACGVSLLGSSLDTFNEIKESACLTTQSTGTSTIQGPKGQKIECQSFGSILNSFSGLCTKNGGPPITTIRVGTIAEKTAEDLGLQKFGESRDLYIIVQEKVGSGISNSIMTLGFSGGFSIQLGVVVKNLEFQKSKGGTELAYAENSRLTEKLDVVEYPGAQDFQRTYFNQGAIDEFRKSGKIPQGFEQRLADASGKPVPNAKSIYQQVIDAMGSPEKEYIIKPNEGLLNSIRCICFPSFIAYLRLWKNILSAVRNCFNTILLTGDGSSGICQAVISKYGCDLLYEVLACFTQNFSTGNARIGATGLGDVLGALTSAGTEMSRSVEGRYGNTGMYNAVFVEKKLVHSVCMWAFTGTWNFDVAAVFDQAIDEIPTDSYPLLYPCERRFVAFSPATTPGGLVTWVYHFGVGFAAGADADIELHLKCSGGYKCKDIDGFEKGKCDCDTEKDMIVRPEGLATSVSKNDILNQEIFYTIAGSPGEGQIRYDKAYILYKYNDGNKIVEKKDAECTISLIGGPSTVPAFCRFDPFTLSFRCQFGEAEGAVRFIKATATPAQGLQGTPVFTLGENLNVVLDIQQDYPGKEKHNKHLQFDIINPAGQTVFSNKDRGLILLTTNGDYQKTIGPEKSAYTISVAQDWFGATGESRGFEAKQWSIKNAGTLSANTMIEQAQLLTTTGIPSTEANKPFVIAFKYEGGKLKATIHQAETSARIVSADKGIAGGLPIAGCENIEATKEMVCIPTGTTPPFTGQLRIRLTDNRPAADETIQVHIVYNPSATADPCSKENKLRPMPFRIKFTAYDSDQNGQPTDQVTLDPVTGREAIIETTFSAVCARPDDADFKEKITGIPVPSRMPEEITRQINEMIRKEESVKSTLVKDLENPKADYALEHLLSLKREETIMAGELDKYLIGLEKLPELKAELSIKIETLQGILTEPEGSLYADDNIQLSASKAIKTIEELPIPKDVRYIKESIQEVIKTLDGIIQYKKSIITKLKQITGEETTCPDKQEINGDRYLCAETQPTGFEATPTGQTCPATAQKCWKLLKEKYCETTPNKPGFIYQCKTSPEAGWTSTTELFCTPGETCYKKEVPIGPSEMENKIKNLMNALDTVQRLQTPKLQSLQTKERAGDDEYVLPNKREDLQNFYIALISDLKAQATQIEQQLALKAGTAGFGGDTAKAEEAFEKADVLQRSLTYFATTMATIYKDAIPTANIQKLRETVSATREKIDFFIKEEDLIKKMLSEALGARQRCEEGVKGDLIFTCQIEPPPGYVLDTNYQCAEGKFCYVAKKCPEGVFKNKIYVCRETKEGGYYLESEYGCTDNKLCYSKIKPILTITTYSAEEIKKHPTWENMLFVDAWIPSGLSSWKLCAYKDNVQSKCFDTKEYSRTEYNKENGFISFDLDKNKFQEPGTYTIYVEWNPQEAGKEYAVYNGKSEPATVEISYITPPPTPKQTKIIKPAYLEALSIKCRDGYKYKGHFADDNDDWAYPDGSSTPRKAGQFLQLCVAKELENNIALDSAYTEKYDCDPGWDHKGWITNDYDDWATDSANNILTDKEYLHLCVNKDAITQYGDFAYLAWQGKIGNKGYCKEGDSFAGIFEFSYKGLAPAGWQWCSVRFVDGRWEKFTPAWAGEDKWIGLCVKPVTITIK